MNGLPGQEMPLVSVIVPAYNIEDYIAECIGSIQRQTYQNLQIILVDDGSCDNTGRICDEYARLDTRVEVIHKKTVDWSAPERLVWRRQKAFISVL